MNQVFIYALFNYLFEVISYRDVTVDIRAKVLKIF